MNSLCKNAAKTRWLRWFGVTAFVALVISACSSESPPSKGNIGVVFPSTAAAMSVDFLDFYVFDVPASDVERVNFCQNRIQARKKGDALPSTFHRVWVCALDSVKVPYGEHAVMTVGVQNFKDTGERDLLIGCTLQTFGEGDAVLPVTLSLIDEKASLTTTACSTLSQYCAMDGKCN